MLNSQSSSVISMNGNHGSDNSSGSSVISSADSSDSSTILAPRQPTRVVAADERRCWICFGDSSDSQGKWVKPCQCSLEAHQTCLLDWIAENQKASPTKRVNCPQCATPYHLSQSNSITLALLTVVDSLVRTSAPYITVLGVGCSLLFSFTTYGAYSVMSVFGQRDGERLIGSPNQWSYKTWIGLPLIPVVLISTKTRWGDIILPVAAVSVLRATGNNPLHIKPTWPISPAMTITLMPWVSFLYKNAYRHAQLYLRKNLSLEDTSSLMSSSSNISNTSNTPSRPQRSSSNDIISDRERNLELDMINGRGASSIGISVLGALLWPVISSCVGGVLNIGNLIYKYERIRQYRSRRVKSYEEVIKATSRRRHR
ncbi:hypothetical protein [Parasitella parasitica]|uniref:RING-CH-type domain-containing protein n=1 Tax=Parasitella parasitica TaxID=35722 RepID=A0A0B7NI87_9FUNG|nr:hypothetical protein [Parasitella parasitica]